MPDIPRIRPVPQLPNDKWNEASRRYIGRDGRFVKFNKIRGALDEFITVTTDSMELVSRQLIASEISLAEWQTTMMQLSKEANLAGGALESGGWYQMGPEEFGRVGGKMKQEYKFLQNFAEEIADGRQPLNGNLSRRARLYGEQGRVTYYDHAKVSAKKDGFDEESSVLTPADHCDECVGEDKRGFVRLGDITPIGSRECLSNCKCFMKYRNSRTGKIRFA